MNYTELKWQMPRSSNPIFFISKSITNKFKTYFCNGILPPGLLTRWRGLYAAVGQVPFVETFTGRKIKGISISGIPLSFSGIFHLFFQ